MIDDRRIIVALDFNDKRDALKLCWLLDPKKCRVKVGKELFTRAGPELVEMLQALGFEVFLDLKYHDIPNTVKNACHAAADLGVWMVNIHASGGRKMMDAAVEGIVNHSDRPLLTAVTVLTSFDDADLKALGFKNNISKEVDLLTFQALQAGCDGVITSPREVKYLRNHYGDGTYGDLLIVTPGIRQTLESNDDQKRFMTPKQAIKAGADYLVIGRPIHQAPDPAKALDEIINSLT